MTKPINSANLSTLLPFHFPKMKKKICTLLTLTFLLTPLHTSAEESAEALYRSGVEAYNIFSEGSIEESIALFNSTIRKDPDFAPAYSSLAESYIQKFYRSDERNNAILNKAFQLAEKALVLAPRSAQSHKSLGSAYHAKGKIEEAVEEFERAVDMAPDYARAWVGLGTSHNELGDQEKAIAFYRRAAGLKNDPLAEGISYFNLASIQSTDRIYKSALENYGKAEELVPSYYNIHYGKGVVLMNLGSNEEAMKAFQRAVELKPDHAESWFGLAGTYHRLGYSGRAMDAYNRVLEIDHDHDEAREGLMRLKQ